MERSRAGDARGDGPSPTTDAGQGELFPAGEYREEFYYSSSPIVPAEELLGYKQVDPKYPDIVLGWSGQIINSKIKDQSRTVWAEAFASITSSIGIPLIQLASLAGTVWLGLEGHPIPAGVTSIPVVGITIAQLTVVFKARPGSPDSAESSE